MSNSIKLQIEAGSTAETVRISVKTESEDWWDVPVDNNAQFNNVSMYYFSSWCSFMLKRFANRVGLIWNALTAKDTGIIFEVSKTQAAEYAKQLESAANEITE